MWHCMTFETKAEAQKYQKEHGGYLYYEQRTPKRKQLTALGKEWDIAVRACGFDREKAKYIVEKRV